MATIKNTASGARGIRNTSGDLVMIEAGQSAEGDFSAAEVKDFKSMLAYEAGETAAPADDADTSGTAPKALSAMNKAELLKVAADEGVTTAKDADGNDVAVADATNKQIVAAIEAKRAAA